MLTPRHQIRENSTKWQVLGKAGRSRRLEDAGAKQRAALGDRSRLKLVPQALLERRGLATPSIGVQVAEVAMQGALHLVNSRRRFGAKQLDERVFRRSPACARHAGLAVIHQSVEHTLQRPERRGRDPADEKLPERQQK